MAHGTCIALVMKILTTFLICIWIAAAEDSDDIQYVNTELEIEIGNVSQGETPATCCEDNDELPATNGEMCLARLIGKVFKEVGITLQTNELKEYVSLSPPGQLLYEWFTNFLNATGKNYTRHEIDQLGESIELFAIFLITRSDEM
ncbi:hypothetical protein IscW_ISCW001397 [Ixodes scapularis]|uniref:Secreted protein n=1 Tax=Ixodes scapularis TaxID=6945 RepID=B7P0J7_IXOSC|nr:hypothetical protein IscW_ISCW001397 [Ixodes scapularis]|eukprot:XP_002399188.1 hypothetical protein IscW_ISCW001397 [Ixodes scapularis]